MIKEIRICSNRTTRITKQLLADIERKVAIVNYFVNINFIYFTPLSNEHLGVYNIEEQTIFLSEKLLHDVPYETILSIALHEAAHAVQAQTMFYTSHDNFFREICYLLGADETYARAKVDIKAQTKLLDKIKKLKALSESPFEAEAQSALLKARALMIEHSIKEDFTDEEDSIYECDLYEGLRINNKYKALLNIVTLITGTFGILTYRDEFSVLRIYGSYDEVEVAIYLYETLMRSIDKEIAKKRKEMPYLYKGINATTNFYNGVYSAIKERYSSKTEEANTKAIIAIQERNTEKAERIVFSDSKIKTTRQYFRKNGSIYDDGVKYGSNVNLNRPIKYKEKDKHLLT